MQLAVASRQLAVASKQLAVGSKQSAIVRQMAEVGSSQFRVKNEKYLRKMKNLIKNNVLRLLMVVIAVLMITACTRPVVKIENIPANTPKGARIYVSGNFNRWDPGDQRFVMEMGADSSYYLMLPRGFGEVQYKFTRGDWTSVETDICGYDVNNRSFFYGKKDTMVVSVQSWKDLEAINCPEVTIVLDALPGNTPADEPIAIAGNFNEWLPDSSSVFTQDRKTGKYFITLPRKENTREIEYKITRGNLLKAEADRFGNEIDKRKLQFGEADTVFVAVESWEDLKHGLHDKVTIIINTVPPSTLPNDIIYITGSFNGWYPKDNKYILQKNKTGKYQIDMPKTQDNIEFKFTRGDWSKQEVDRWGYKIPNRSFRFGQADTMQLEIENWEDRSKEIPISYLFIIDKLPKSTPDDPKFFLAGSINGWDANSKKYRFEKLSNGKYFLKVECQVPSFEFKITRGNWNSEEADNQGNKIINRLASKKAGDTTRIEILNWIDIPLLKQESVVLLIDSLPGYMPKGQKIFVAGNFNNWNPGNPDYVMNRNLKGNYYITIPKRGNEIAFKFTMGSWDSEELDNDFSTISNRNYRFGFSDTLRLKVENWEGFDD